MECQQYYCTPCRSLHDKMTVSRHHNVLPFSAATATQQDQRTVARKCPKHDFQREIFFCTACDVTICPHCKLTSHEGHVTEDLSDAATKARQELQRMLGEIQQRVRLLEMREAGTKKALVRLQAEFNSADDVIKKRTDDVVRWAEQAGAEALDAARELCHVIEDSLNQRLEATQHVMSGLTARTKHITTVLSGEDNAEVMKLLADITAADGSGGNETTGVGEDTADGGDCKSGSGQETGSSQFLLVQHDDTGNERSAITSYIGRVFDTKPSSGVPADTARSALVAASVQADASTQHQEMDMGASAKRQHDKREKDKQSTSNQDTENTAELSSATPLTCKLAIPRSSSSLQTGTSSDVDPYRICLQRQLLPEHQSPNRSYSYSSSPGTAVIAMCLTSDNKLWVKCKPPHTHIDILKLFGTDGDLLRFWNNRVPKGNSLTCVHDTLLSPLDWCWLKPTGETGFLGNPPNDWALCSKSLPPQVVLYDARSKEYKVYRLHVRCLHPLQVALVAVCEKGVKLEKKPTEFDVSSEGTVFCFLYEMTVDVYCLNDLSTSPSLVRLAHCSVATLINNSKSFTCVSKVHDVAFIRLGGKDILVVVLDWASGFNMSASGHVLVVLDHDDGFFVKLCDSGNVVCTILTAHNTGGRLWLGQQGGHICVRDLTKETLS